MFCQEIKSNSVSKSAATFASSGSPCVSVKSRRGQSILQLKAPSEAKDTYIARLKLVALHPWLPCSLGSDHTAR